MSSVTRSWGGQPSKCKLCTKTVYAAEEAMANGFKYHKMCLKCENCSKLLQAGGILNHESNIYCSNCHMKLFGPKGVSGGIIGVSPSNGPTILQERKTSNSANIPAAQTKLKTSNHLASKFGGAPSCGRCTKPVYMAEQVLACGRTYHKLCFKCNECSKMLATNTLCERDGSIYCKTCYGKNFGPKGFGFGISTMPTTGGPVIEQHSSKPVQPPPRKKVEIETSTPPPQTPITTPITADIGVCTSSSIASSSEVSPNDIMATGSSAGEDSTEDLSAQFQSSVKIYQRQSTNDEDPELLLEATASAIDRKYPMNQAELRSGYDDVDAYNDSDEQYEPV